MVKRIAIALGILLILVMGAATWLLTTSGGAQLVLSQATRAAGGGIRYEGVEGSLGGPMKIAVIEVDRPELYVRIEGFEMDSSPWAPFRGRLVIYRLEAAKVEVRTVSTGAAAQVPVSFAAPYPLTLERGHVGELRLGELTKVAAAEKDPAKRRALIEATRTGDLVVKEIALRGEGDASMWKVDEASAATPYGKGKLAGTIRTRAPFTLDAKLSADGVAAERQWRAEVVAKGTLTAIEATLSGAVSEQPATGRVRVEPFEKQPLRALALSARGVDVSKYAPGPHTSLDVEVQLDAVSNAFGGNLKIVNAEPGPWDRERIPVASISTRTVITAERLDLHDLQIALAGGGSAAGRASLTRERAEADLTVAGVDLAALHTALQKTHVAGKLAVSGDTGAQRFELSLADPRFQVDGRATLAKARVDIETATIRTGGGSVTAKGQVALSGKREFRLEGNAQHFDPSAFVKSTKGDLNFAFVTSGSLTPAIAGEAKVDIAPSTVAGVPASGRIAVAGDGKRIASLDLDVVFGEAHATAKGGFGAPGDALDFTLDAPNLSTLAKPAGLALYGKLQGEGRLTGTFASPAGRVALKGANLALPGNVYVADLALRLEAGTEESSPVDGELRVKGLAMGAEKPPTPMAEEAVARIKGTRIAHHLELDAKMNREASLRLALAGGLDPKAKAPAWSGRVESLSLTGRGAFSLAQPASLSFSAEHVELGDARLKGEWGEAHFIVTRWTPRTLDVKGTSAAIQVQNFARSFHFTEVPRSSLVVAADWDVHAAEQFDGTASLRRISGDLRVGDPPLSLGLETLEAKLEVVRGRAKATVALAGARVGKLEGEGTATIARGKSGWEIVGDAPVSALLTAGHTNIEALAPWLGPDAKLGGRIDASVRVTGTGASPRLSGEARATDLTLHEPQTGFEVEKGDIAVKLSGRSLAIERFSATVPWHPVEAATERMKRAKPPTGGGQITAEGAIDLDARTGAIRLKLDQVPVTQLPTRFLALSGEAKLEAGAKELVVSGALNVDAGWIGALDTPPPSVSEDVIVVRKTAPAAEEASPREPIRLDMKLSAGDSLYFQGRGLNTRLVGDVHLTGTPGPGLRATGSIRTTGGGTYDGYGQKLTIERGVLTFQGPLDAPRLNVLALRKGLPVEAGVEVLGTTTRPRVRLVSVPDVPEPEKLSWLVLGRSASDASLGDSAVMMAAARALLGNNTGSDLTKKFGIDEIKVGRADNSVLGVLPQSTVAGRTGTASAADVVSVGKRINNDINLTYEQGLSDAEGTLKLAWRITRQFQLLARAGYLPGLDAVYRWRFQ